MSFIHLHCHSDFSLLDGAVTLGQLVGRAKALGMPAVALTDHGNLFGALKFYKECQKKGIKPIIGCEVYVASGSRLDRGSLGKVSEDEHSYYHLVLLCENEKGWENLKVLSSLGYTEGFYYRPRIDRELLEKHHEGLICLSACLAGEIPRLLAAGRRDEAREQALWYQNLFGPDHYYLELQDHGISEEQAVNEGLVEISRETGIPLVCTNDCHYLSPDDANVHDTLLCIGTSKKKNDLNRMAFSSSEFYFKTPEEMQSLFAHVPEALENTLKIGEMVDLKLNLPGPLLPDFDIPSDFGAESLAQAQKWADRIRSRNFPLESQFLANLEKNLGDPVGLYLVSQSNKGLVPRYKTVTEEIAQRMDYELAIIMGMDFVGYFLIVADFIGWAKDHGVPVGPGRGSGAGSIVAYSLRITDLDPLRYKLLFERFLNPERVSMPDFDVDFADEGRGDVIKYVTQRYGEEKVGQIITFGTLKAKAVLKDVARALGISFAESNEISKLVDDKAKDEDGKELHIPQHLEKEPVLKQYMERGGVYQELFESAIKLEGMNRHASTHAAGVVIGKTKLTDFVPLYRDPKTGAVSTQFTMEQLEECGLVKMDFLGLKTLTIIKNTLQLLQDAGIPIQEDDIPEDDAKTFKMLSEGNSAMVFQFESAGMQKVLKKAKPKSIEDLIALNALYRPGPMQFIDQFAESKNGQRSISYPHKDLEPVLKETYGVIVYQEQVMEIARVIGGYSLGSADILRRAMGKKKAEEMVKQKILFVEGAVKKGYNAQLADDIFELLLPFAGYGFNKSHAAAYSVIAYKTAYLKANYPAQYLAANLTNEINNPDKLGEYLEVAKEMGIQVLPPHVNLSGKQFAVVDGQIVFGLLGVKNIGEGAVEEILRARKEGGAFTSFQEFLERVDLRVVNKKVFETGIQCGIFDGLGYNRFTLWQNLENWISVVAKRKDEKLFGQTGLFDEDTTAQGHFTPQLAEEWPQRELLTFEKTFIGLYVSGHPLDPFKNEWKTTRTVDLSDPRKTEEDKSDQLLGILMTLEVKVTQKGARMAWGRLEDFKGSIELVFFPKVYEICADLLAPEAILGVKGRVDFNDEGKAKFVVKEVFPAGGLSDVRSLSVHIRLRKKEYTEAEAVAIRDFLLDQSGAAPLYLHIPQESGETVIRSSPQIHVRSTPESMGKIEAQSWAGQVWRE